ncbi:hypothetical protein DFH28DRAFT_1083356 [Melampsora americana]|nr:hypothetical protein DFH28DRAFT_1083356 [Melampsora americana]
MANPSSTPPAEINLTGPMNNREYDSTAGILFELPDKHVGDDQGAISIWQNPLYCCGTPVRIEFDQKNQMMIKVRFKIYTPKAVDLNIPSQSPDKVGAGKKPVKSMKLNLINSKKMKGKYFEIKSCLMGKSLNEFKILVADACEGYLAHMKTIILNRSFLPKLKWKTTVGEKSIKKQGVLVIKNKNVDVQSIEENTESATRQLIKQTNGHGTHSRVLKPSISGYAGGDGTVLSVPWNPAFQYCLTYRAAWIWAKDANIAAQHLPPNTCEFNQEIKKSEWQHPNMGVDDWLKAVQSTSTFKDTKVRHSSLIIDSTPDLKNVNNKPFIDLTKQNDSKPDLENVNNKRIIDLTDPIDSKANLKKHFNLTEPTEIKPDVNEILMEASKNLPSDVDESEEDKSDSDVEIPTSQHSIQMEFFLADCNIPYEDKETCQLLKAAGIISWTNLIPSIQMTESTLTPKGINCQIASRLMDEAKACYYTNCKFPIAK